MAANAWSGTPGRRAFPPFFGSRSSTFPNRTGCRSLKLSHELEVSAVAVVPGQLAQRHPEAPDGGPGVAFDPQLVGAQGGGKQDDRSLRSRRPSREFSSTLQHAHFFSAGAAGDLQPVDEGHFVVRREGSDAVPVAVPGRLLEEAAVGGSGEGILRAWAVGFVVPGRHVGGEFPIFLFAERHLVVALVQLL